MSSLTIQRLGGPVGAEVSGVDADALANEPGIGGAVLEALEENGVLIFRGLNLAPEAQVAFAGNLGAVDYEEGYHPVRGISRITRDAAKRPTAEYLAGTFLWHIDGCTPLHDENPQRATILSAVAIADAGGETEFASTYAAYDDLSQDEKHRYLGLQVEHSFEASMRQVYPDATSEQLDKWRRRPTHINPLVWTHLSGRRSMVLGSSADHVVGLALNEGRALLSELLERATITERVYRHEWGVGDTVIWDNRGVLHRALAYPPDSPREMLRTTVLGDEPIQ
jgi:alpha-ketoglutarate-dependent sulfate ester dioxygenase